MVRIPGDKKSADRRYAQCHDAAGIYYREMTQAEEESFGHGVSDWSKREPEFDVSTAETRASVLAGFRDRLSYEKRVVAFLDILGWRAAVEKSSTDQALASKLGEFLGLSLSQAQATREGGLSVALGSIRFTHFSDSIVVSAPLAPATQFVLWMYLTGLINSLLRLGFLVRGGITEGLVVHEERMIYGSGLNRAYDLERLARFPRIILDDQLAAVWGKGLSGSTIGESPQRELFTNFWCLDSDGRWFFDFLRPSAIVSGPPAILLESNRLHFSRVRELITKGLSEHQASTSVGEKYRWMAQYFNKVLNDHSETGVAGIALTPDGQP